MDPFSLDHIFPYTLHTLPQMPRSGLVTAYTVIRVIFRDIRAPRSLALRLSGANGQTPRLFVPCHCIPVAFSFLPSSCQRTVNCSVRSFGSPPSDDSRPTLEVWGLEPQTYGLQSHRSSH